MSRQNVLNVETRIEPELAWERFIENRRRAIRILVATARPGRQLKNAAGEVLAFTAVDGIALPLQRVPSDAETHC
jgi:hypothetical protein